MSRCNSRRSASSGSSAPQRALMQAWVSSFEGIAQSTAKYIAALAQILQPGSRSRLPFRTLCLVPKPIQLRQGKRRKLDALFCGERFYRAEPSSELFGGRLQEVLRIQASFSRKIHNRK